MAFEMKLHPLMIDEFKFLPSFNI